MPTQPPSPDQTETKTPLLTTPQILSQLGVEPTAEPTTSDCIDYLRTTSTPQDPLFRIEENYYDAYALYIAAATADKALKAAMLTSNTSAEAIPSFAGHEVEDASSLADIARGEIHFELRDIFIQKRAEEVIEKHTIRKLNKRFSGKKVQIITTVNGEVTENVTKTCERISEDPSGGLNIVTTNGYGYQFLPEEITETSVKCNFAYTLHPERTRTISLAS